MQARHVVASRLAFCHCHSLQAMLCLICDTVYSELHRGLNGFIAAEHIGNVKRLVNKREWSIPSADALDGRLQAKEATLLHGADDLGAKAARARRFVRNHHAASLGDRLRRLVGRVGVRYRVDGCVCGGCRVV